MKNNDMSEDHDIDNGTQELVQCSACLRRMRQDVFAKHPNVCCKNLAHQRNVRVFDMTQYRSMKAGDKIIPIRQASSVNINRRPSQTRSAKRDRRSDTFVPPVIDNFCCPRCKRTFCEKAYDRHVTFCTSKIKQIQQTPSEEILLARLKLDRRMKFTSQQLPSKTSSFLPTSVINQNPFCLLPLRKKHSTSLVYCPWCSKAYIPNCIHYCRNAKDLF